MSNAGKLGDLAWDLYEEFERYARSARPPENPLFEYDLSFPLGAQLIAARLGYRIFPANDENLRAASLWGSYPARPTYARIRNWWDGENKSCPIGAALGPSNVTVLEIIDARNLRGFRNLARLEDSFGRLPRTRITATPTGFQIHMRGVELVADDSLGEGLVLLSAYHCALLPGTHKGSAPHRWLRVGNLEAAPDWLLGPRARSAEAECGR